MQNKGNYRYRVLSVLLMCTLIISTMAGCSSKKKGSEDTTKTETQTPSNGETTKPKAPPEMKTLPLDTKLMTVDGKDYTISDFMYLIYSMEEHYNSGENSQEGLDFWNDIFDETTNETGREYVLNEMKEMAKRNIIVKQLADKAGIKLSDEVKGDIAEMVQDTLDNMDDEHKKRTGFTKENLTQQITDLYLVEEYYDAQVDKEKVNEASIKAGVNYEDYKQRQVEFVYVETVINDAYGEKQEKTAEEVAALVKTANQILDKAKEGKDLQDAYTQFAGEDNADILYDDQAITDGDTETYPEEFFRAVDGLKEGQVCDRLIQVDGGYYIIKLTSNKATALYDDTVEDLILQAKQSAYDEELEKIYNTHSIIENGEAWDQLVLGEYAYTISNEPEDNEDDKFETNDSNSQGGDVLPADAANEEDGSVG